MYLTQDFIAYGICYNTKNFQLRLIHVAVPSRVTGSPPESLKGCISTAWDLDLIEWTLSPQHPGRQDVSGREEQYILNSCKKVDVKLPE